MNPESSSGLAFVPGLRSFYANPESIPGPKNIWENPKAQKLPPPSERAARESIYNRNFKVRLVGPMKGWRVFRASLDLSRTPSARAG